MKTRNKIALGILVFVAVDGFRVNVLNKRRIKKANETIKSLEEELTTAALLSQLFAAKLNQHRIPLDEFDVVVMDGLNP